MAQAHDLTGVRDFLTQQLTETQKEAAGMKKALAALKTEEVQPAEDPKKQAQASIEEAVHQQESMEGKITSARDSLSRLIESGFPEKPKVEMTPEAREALKKHGEEVKAGIEAVEKASTETKKPGEAPKPQEQGRRP